MRPMLLLLVMLATACHGFTIEPGTWRFRGYPIAYEHATANGDNAEGTPVLLLNGFGMGSFHQHRLMEALLAQQQGWASSVYGIDYLGQGKSWPEDCADGESENEKGLRYCGKTWVDQIIGFIEDNIVGTNDNNKVHLVGNSVGGHFAVFIAAARPDLIETVTLLNATPVWGLNLPGWSGHLPAPVVPKLLGRFLFDRMRDERTIQEFLNTTYVNPAAYDNALVQKVRGCTEGNGGHAAFASILWSPPITVQLPCGSNDQAGFYDCLQAIKCDVLLCFGRDDPWCKPAFAKRMLQSLASRNEHTQRYVELSDVGHCANHEAPMATARVLTRWLQASDRRPGKLSLLPAEKVIVKEAWGDIIVQERKEEDIPFSFIDLLAATFV